MDLLNQIENIGDGVSQIYNANQDNNNLSVGAREYFFNQNTQDSQSDSDEDPIEYASQNGYHLKEFGKLELPFYP